jgi:membrane protein
MGGPTGARAPASMKPKDARRRHPTAIVKSALRKFYEDDGLFLARGLAFGLLVYCIPLALLTVSVLSYTITNSGRALLWVRRLSVTLIPQFQDAFNSYLTSIVLHRGLLGIGGLLAFLFVGSTTFGSVRIVLNRIFNVREPRGIAHRKTMEVVMMVGASLLFYGITAFVYLLNLFDAFAAHVWLVHLMHPAVAFTGSVIGFVSTIVFFGFLYRFSPARKLTWKASWTAALMAACLFEFSKLFFGFYVGYGNRLSALYGTLSTLVFFILWLYYTCIVFVYAAEVGWISDHPNWEFSR